MVSQSKQPIRMLGLAVLLSALVLGVGCATHEGGPARQAVSPFSAAQPGDALPPGWAPWSLTRFKKDTAYQLVSDTSGVTVIEAKSDQSASGLRKHLDIDPASVPWIHWRWHVPTLIPSADNSRRDLEDSPVRVVITFDGNMDKLDFEERALAARIKALTGQAMPYATLMYIWENKVPRDSVMESHHTTRVKMIVAESGTRRSGDWVEFERNVMADFERAFGEKPGRIKTLGIMTDTDNTGESAVAYYGDIRFTPVATQKGNVK